MRLAEYEAIALNIGLLVFAGFIFFIIYDLAKQSKAGKFGTLILFLTLGLGLGVFLVKELIVYLMDM